MHTYRPTISWYKLNSRCKNILFCKIDRIYIYNDGLIEMLLSEAFLTNGSYKKDFILLYTDVEDISVEEVSIITVLDYITKDNKLIKINSI